MMVLLRIVSFLTACVVCIGANQAWIGKWESIAGREAGVPEFLATLGLPLPQYKVGAKVFHEFWTAGEVYKHKVLSPEQGFKEEVEFQLNEDRQIKVNDTDIKFRYEESGANLVAYYQLLNQNKAIQEDYIVNGNELEKKFKVGLVQASKWFQRVKAENAVAAKL